MTTDGERQGRPCQRREVAVAERELSEDLLSALLDDELDAATRA